MEQIEAAQLAVNAKLEPGGIIRLSPSYEQRLRGRRYPGKGRDPMRARSVKDRIIVARTNYPVAPTAYSGRRAGESSPSDQEMCYFELRAAIGPGRPMTMIEGERMPLPLCFGRLVVNCRPMSGKSQPTTQCHDRQNECS